MMMMIIRCDTHFSCQDMNVSISGICGEKDKNFYIFLENIFRSCLFCVLYM